MYKILRFIVQKISPFSNKNVHVPSFNIHSSSFKPSGYDSLPTSSSDLSELAGSSSGSRKYDVFLNFLGEDTRKTFDHLYSALEDLQINTYKDDKTLPRGQSIGPSLKKAIKESKIAIIVFSKNYANSSWCLDELAYIMKCKEKRGLAVFPIFYGVDPGEVRKQNGDFGKAFAKQEAKNITKVESWRKALVHASNISGWEPKNIANGHEAKVIKKIVDTIFKRLHPLDLNVDGDLVGMDERIRELESLLEIGLDDVRMVGIWGIGGSGKTTLATSFYMKMSHHFQGQCIVGDVREGSRKFGLERLQEKILSSVSKRKVEVQSSTEGKRKIKHMLCHRKVLILLDDVDNLCQLEALVGNHNWFGSGSRIIITTRDKHLLRKVDKVYHVRLLLEDEAIQLFNRHAYNENNPIEEYKALSLHVVSYAAGLPLALKVLGSFLYDKVKTEWMGTLDRLKDIPETEIVEKLKISYDGLKTIEKDLFLDIACFLRFEDLDDAKDILEACGYYPDIGLKVLRQKALITTCGKFDMHDMVQEMGHYIVRGKHPNNPEKHSRIWEAKDLKKICLGDATMENNKIEAIHCQDNLLVQDSHFSIEHFVINLSRLCICVSNMKKLRWLRLDTRDNYYNSDETNGSCYDGPILQYSNELRYIYWTGYPGSRPFADTFNLENLVVLKLSHSYQEELWKDCKHLPRLKKFYVEEMAKLVKIPELGGVISLQKLKLYHCPKLEVIHQSLGNCTSLEYVEISYCHKLKIFPTFFHMKNLKRLWIYNCHLSDGEIPSGLSELFNLQELSLSSNDFSRLNSRLSRLINLKLLDLSRCNSLIELPELPASLAILIANDCLSLSNIGDCYKSCEWLCQVSFWGSRCNINDGGRLLQSMVEGKANESGCMLLKLPGVEISKIFTPHMVKGNRYRLKLPRNWCNIFSGFFSGFLICLVVDGKPYSHGGFRVRISANKGMDFRNNEVWEESYRSKEMTSLGYVPFGSLRDTLWWDPTYNSLFFSIEVGTFDMNLSGIGVRLVEKKSKNVVTKTSTTNSSSPYTPELKIIHDSTSALVLSLDEYYPEWEWL